MRGAYVLVAGKGVFSTHPLGAELTIGRDRACDIAIDEKSISRRHAILRVGADNDTYAVVLTGAGRGFCSGLDLEDHGIPPNIAGLRTSLLATRYPASW